jgi:hypothetical protein
MMSARRDGQENIAARNIALPSHFVIDGIRNGKPVPRVAKPFVWRFRVSLGWPGQSRAGILFFSMGEFLIFLQLGSVN